MTDRSNHPHTSNVPVDPALVGGAFQGHRFPSNGSHDNASHGSSSVTGSRPAHLSHLYGLVTPATDGILSPLEGITDERALRSRLSRIRAELRKPFPDGLPVDLPIRSYLSEVVASVEKFPFTIVTSPTGSGKTIGIPYQLLTKQYGVVVTQPRIIAARGAATFLAECIGEPVGERVGYRTAKERCDSASTVCQFVTDGLEVMRILRNPTRMSLGNRWVLMVDEFHERNLNHDVLLAYLKTLHRQGKLTVPVIVSSATLDTASIAQHLGPESCNVVKGTGRMFDVERVQGGKDSVLDGVAYAAQGEPGILHFVPGKREIYDRMDRYDRALTAEGIDAVVLALHSELSAEQQLACMKDYGKTKIIVCTNIAEASITVPGVSVVVDEGQRRTIRTKNGVQGLYTERTSNAECDQRAGRAGRLRPGIYVSHHTQPEDERSDYPEPEITRLQLDNMVLRIRAQGHDPRELRFLDRPSDEAFESADERLQILGCLDGGFKCTALGRKLADLPLSVNLGRMILEAERLGVLADALEVAAVVEAGGIVDLGSNKWRSLVAPRCQSDALAQRDVFRWAQSFERNTEQRDDMGINENSFAEASEHLRELRYRFRDQLKDQVGMARDSQKLLMQALCVGFRTNVFVCRGDTWRDARDTGRRELDSLSVIGQDTRCIVGVPWDLNLAPQGRTKHLIRWATAASLNELPPRLRKLVREWDSDRSQPHKVDARSPRHGFAPR